MIYVKVLGPTVVEVDGERLPEAALGGRLRQVLEILAVNAGQPVPKEVLADRIWDGSPPATYLGTLESYVCVLRKRLGLAGGRRSSLATRDRGYVLDGPDVRVDLQDFRALTNGGPRRPEDRVRTVLEALALVRGPLLAQEPYAGWAAQAREAFDQELTETLVPAAALANELGEFDSAKQLARAAIERHAYSEVAWQELIRAHWRAGDRGEALGAYATLRQLLLDELGEQPSRPTQELYLNVLRETDEGRQGAQRQELGLLLRLLRQALEGVPGVAVPSQDAALSRAAIGFLEHGAREETVLAGLA
jgi:DNA-binding SARP family transcriptional activator